MVSKQLISRIQDLVAKATELKNRYITDKQAPVNYACIFTQSEDEFVELCSLAKEFGSVIKETDKGPIFKIEPLATDAGVLQLLKIRRPDAEHPDLGDADFTIKDFDVFQNKYLGQSGFKLIQKENFVMMELMESGCDVRVYFSHPPLDEQFNIK